MRSGGTKGEATSEVEAPTPTAESSDKPEAKTKPKRRIIGKTQHQRVVRMLPPTPSSAWGSRGSWSPELPREKEEGGRGDDPKGTAEEAGAAVEGASG